MVKIIKGDLLDCKEDIIIHQVNVNGCMRRRSSKTTIKQI